VLVAAICAHISQIGAGRSMEESSEKCHVNVRGQVADCKNFNCGRGKVADSCDSTCSFPGEVLDGWSDAPMHGRVSLRSVTSLDLLVKILTFP
jgi:hypothetical protein